MDVWINLERYTPAQLLLNGAGCFGWLVAYAALLWQIKRRQYVEMPALVAGANIGWELVWSTVCQPDSGLLYLWMYRGAFLLDVGIFLALLRYGHKQPMPPGMRAHFRPVVVVNALVWAALCWFFAREGYDTGIGANSGYVINVFLSSSCLLMLLRSEERTDFSAVIAWSKMLGTGLISVSLVLIYPRGYFVQTLGLLCFVLDVTYLFALARLRPAASSASGVGEVLACAHRGGSGPFEGRELHVEQEVHDVAVLRPRSSLPSMRILPAALIAGLAAVLLEIGERVDLGADEALLEVGVDHAGRLGAERALADRPRADLLLAGREVRLQAEQAVALARERRERRLRRARTTASSSPRSASAELGELGLDLAAQDDDAGALALRRAP